MASPTDYGTQLQNALGGPDWDWLHQTIPPFFGYGRGYSRVATPYDWRLGEGSPLTAPFPKSADAFNNPPRYGLGEGIVPEMALFPKVIPSYGSTEQTPAQNWLGDKPFPPPREYSYPGGDPVGGNPGQPGGNPATLPNSTKEPSALNLSLLAAGLGILGNNTGHYGAFGPAVGRGGLVGLQTFGAERDRQLQSRKAAEESRLRDEQLKINREQSGYNMRRLKREEDKDARLQAAFDKFSNAKDTITQKSALREIALLQGDADAVLKIDNPTTKPPQTQTGAVMGKDGRPIIDKRSGQPLVQEYAYNEKTGAYDIPAGGTRLASGGLSVSFGQPVAVAGPDGQPKLVQVNPQGQVRDIGMAPASTQKASDAERLAKGYHDRMVNAEGIANSIGSAGYPSEWTSAAGSLPLFGKYAERQAMTPEQQKYRQAQEDWVRAKLRKESGAVISKEEMASEIATYFPQPGDTPEVIAQKEQSRKIAIGAMRDAAGPALGVESKKGDFQKQSTYEGGKAKGLARGDIVDGYTYVGGDPKKPSSWKKQ